MKRGEERDGKRRAFFRIRTGTELVEQHQGLLICLLPEGNDIGHMAGEGTQTLLDRLLITYICVDFREQGEPGMFSGRNVQPCLSHEGKKPHCLEADCLAACIRAGDDQQVIGVSQTDVNGNNASAVDQGMPCLAQVDDPVLIEIRHRGVHFLRQLRAGENEIQCGQHVHIGDQRLAVRCSLFAQVCQDLLDLSFLIRFQLADVIVQLHDRHGFDEQRGAGGGLIVDHARYLGAVLCPHGDTVASVALCDQCILQILSGRSVHDLSKLCVNALLQEADLAPDPAKLRGGVICDLFLGQDAAADLPAQRRQRFDPGKQRCEGIFEEVRIFLRICRLHSSGLILRPVRSDLLLAAPLAGISARAAALRAACCLRCCLFCRPALPGGFCLLILAGSLGSFQQFCDVQQLRGAQTASDLQPAHIRPDIPDAGEGQIPLRIDPAQCVRGLALSADDLRQVIGGLQRAAQRLAGL